MIISTLAQLAGDNVLHGVHDVAQVLLAAEPSPEPSGANINTDGIVQFIATKIAPILSKVLTSSAIAIVGLAFIAGAGALFFFGEGLINLIFG